MSKHDRLVWEDRHRERATEQPAPLPSLVWVPHAPLRGYALDLACGTGRHSVVLLEKGYTVVAADIARTALVCLHDRLPQTQRPNCLRVQVDLDCWPFARDAFDLIVQCDFLDRNLFPSIKEAVRPGGLVLIDTFLEGARTPGSHRPTRRQFLLRREELVQCLNDWQILRREVVDRPAPREAVLARRPRNRR